MRTIIFILTLLTSITAGAQKICFVRDGKICIADANGDNQKYITKKIHESVDPCIAPDGKTIVFTEITKEGYRYIAVVNVESGVIKRFKKIPGRNSYGPRFSPDGSRIAFSYFDDKSVWRVAIVDSGDTNFYILNNTFTTDYFNPVFTSDGSLIIMNDLNNVIGFDLDKKQRFSCNVDAMLDKGNPLFYNLMSTYYIKEKNCLLVIAETDESIYEKDELVCNVSAIFCIDLNTKAIKRLSDNKISASLFTVDEAGKSIYLSGFLTEDRKQKDMRHDIYRMHINGGKYEKIITNAAYATVSKQ